MTMDSLHALKDFHQGEVIRDLSAATINHSCEPNVAIRNGRIVAWACIKSGDEITLDYQRTDKAKFEPFDCNRGAKQCRGRIA